MIMNIKIRLTLLSFLEFAIWGAYLTSMGTYLARSGMAQHIGLFFSIQGVVSLFMPTLMGIVADRWVQAQRLLSLCLLLAGLFKFAVCGYGIWTGDAVQFSTIFMLYTMSLVFYMPTIALTNGVAYHALARHGLEPVKTFPPIRIWGTIGFILSMWVVDLCGIQHSPLQFGWSGVLCLVMSFYALSMPACPVSRRERKGLVEVFGLRAFVLFRKPYMAVFFLFSILVGVCLQVTNGYANPFLTSFKEIPQFAHTFGVQHANILISLSQVSETLCFLLIPFFYSRYGIKRVVLIAMIAWALRFCLFAMGNPGSGVWLFVLSMLVYGVAFDFFNISGSLFVNQEAGPEMRHSAQGVFMMMTNGFGASVGMMMVQQVVNHYVNDLRDVTPIQVWQGWNTCWYIFSAYALVLFFLFMCLFHYRDSKLKQ